MSRFAGLVRRGLAAALLDALHESRRRQAAREIDRYRHLIDEAKAAELWRAIEHSRAQAPRGKPPAASRFILLIAAARRWMQTGQTLVPNASPALVVEKAWRRKSS